MLFNPQTTLETIHRRTPSWGATLRPRREPWPRTDRLPSRLTMPQSENCF